MRIDSVGLGMGGEKLREFASGDLYFSQLSMRQGHQLKLWMEAKVWEARGEIVHLSKWQMSL